MNKINKQTGEIQIFTIKKVSGEKIEEIKPLAIFKIDSQTAYAVAIDEHGQSEFLYCRQQAGDEKNYWGIKVPEAERKILYKNLQMQENFWIEETILAKI